MPPMSEPAMSVKLTQTIMNIPRYHTYTTMARRCDFMKPLLTKSS